ncbi:transposase, partial [Salmonella enterica subsp. enterica serovar Newport str. SHSN004]
FFLLWFFFFFFMPIQNWRLAMSRFIIEFGDRLSDHL